MVLAALSLSSKSSPSGHRKIGRDAAAGASSTSLSSSVNDEAITAASGVSTRASSSLTSPRSEQAKEKASRYIYDEESIPAAEPEELELGVLNGSLEALAEIFPDVQAEVMREMLSTFGEESRLQVVTEALLRHKTQYVKGRWRTPGKTGVQQSAAIPSAAATTVAKTPEVNVPPEQHFRSDSYKAAVKATLSHEFRGLPGSSINAVLAEHNYSYTLARPTLLTLSANSWRFSLSSFLMRRKPPASLPATDHPLIVWRAMPSIESGSNSHSAAKSTATTTEKKTTTTTTTTTAVPMVKRTSSAELDRELYTTLIMPLLRKMHAEQEDNDRAVAEQVNEQEAEAASALYDCECCFMSVTFEQLTTCDAGGHSTCARCVRLAVNEALFGQGWARSIDPQLATVRCLAPPSSAADDACPGRLPAQLVRRALADGASSSSSSSSDLWSKLEERIANDALRASGLRLVRCPACSYAEVDDLYLPSSPPTSASSSSSTNRRERGRIRLKPLKRQDPETLLLVLITLLPLTIILLPLILLFLIPLHILSPTTLPTLVQPRLKVLHRRHRTAKFKCGNVPNCGAVSCLHCSHVPWTDIHICHERSRLALRAHVESAMSAAVKRTCPRCHTSFVKAAGCNKLTCVCGYAMCYLCRAHIGPEDGYRHFCDHFRPRGAGPCTVCGRCDLYRAEDEDVVVARARIQAEKEWIEAQARGGSPAGGAGGGATAGDSEVLGVSGWTWEGRDDLAPPQQQQHLPLQGEQHQRGDGRRRRHRPVGTIPGQNQKLGMWASGIASWRAVVDNLVERLFEVRG
ncbi:MAG: hypothetical protein M1825_003619 [Sarcosagium campestre]|nr:MAG: hypothetical protein M1825_003619 [Sarcosagium campestre]